MLESGFAVFTLGKVLESPDWPNRESPSCKAAHGGKFASKHMFSIGLVSTCDDGDFDDENDSFPRSIWASGGTRNNVFNIFKLVKTAKNVDIHCVGVFTLKVTIFTHLELTYGLNQFDEVVLDGYWFYWRAIQAFTLTLNVCLGILFQVDRNDDIQVFLQSLAEWLQIFDQNDVLTKRQNNNNQHERLILWYIAMFKPQAEC